MFANFFFCCTLSCFCISFAFYSVFGFGLKPWNDHNFAKDGFNRAFLCSLTWFSSFSFSRKIFRSFLCWTIEIYILTHNLVIRQNTHYKPREKKTYFSYKFPQNKCSFLIFALTVIRHAPYSTPLIHRKYKTNQKHKQNVYEFTVRPMR